MTSTTSRLPHDPITREALVEVFVKAQRPDPTTHLIGTELEKAGVFVPPDGGLPRPVSYDEHVLPTLRAMVDRFGWAEGPDRGPDGEIIELVRDGASITLEPGGQLELSGAPLHNVHETCAEFSQHYDELHEVSQPLSLAWMAVGHHPWATRDEIHWMPKGRYRVMKAYLPTVGGRALDMMLRTCTVQANFDFASEAQCAERFRLANAMAPVLAAIFANSPYLEGRSASMASVRNDVWLDVDRARSGVPRFAFDGFSYERYVDWALDVPMFFVKRDGKYHAHHQTFSHYLDHGMTTPDGTHYEATHADWSVHLSTVFPEVRLKPYLELRSADAVGSRYVCALPALAKGLLYDDDAAGEAWTRLSDFTYEQRQAQWKDAIVHGLRDPGLCELAGVLLGLARDALERANIRDSKGRTEARFIERLDELVDRRQSPGHGVLAELGDTPGRDNAGRRALVRAFHFAGVGAG